MSITNVVFDFGGVVCDFRFNDVLIKAGCTPEHAEYLNKNVFNSPEIEVGENTGKITRAQAFELLHKKFPDEKEILDFIYKNDLKHTLPLRPQVLEFVKEVRAKGFKTFGLSNLSLAAHETFKDQYPGFDELFDGITASYRVGAIKPHSQKDPNAAPDTTIYKRFFKDNNVDPKTAVFIDDKESNLEMGRTFGMAGIQWTDSDNVDTIRKKLSQVIQNSRLEERNI